MAVRDLPPDVTGGQAGAIPGELLAKMPYRDAVDLARDRVSREYLAALLQEFDGNVTRAAAEVGMLRPNFQALMRKHQITGSDIVDEDA